MSVYPNGCIGRYTLENAVAELHNPGIFLGEFYRLGVGINIVYHHYTRSNLGVHIMDEDWDNLIILDVCRSDASKIGIILRGTSNIGARSAMKAVSFPGRISQGRVTRYRLRYGKPSRRETARGDVPCRREPP